MLYVLGPQFHFTTVFFKFLDFSSRSFIGGPTSDVNIKYIFDLPNNRAANLIIFCGKNSYTTILGPTRLLIFEIFPSQPDFHLHK